MSAGPHFQVLLFPSLPHADSGASTVTLVKDDGSEKRWDELHSSERAWVLRTLLALVLKSI